MLSIFRYSDIFDIFYKYSDSWHPCCPGPSNMTHIYIKSKFHSSSRIVIKPTASKKGLKTQNQIKSFSKIFEWLQVTTFAIPICWCFPQTFWPTPTICRTWTKIYRNAVIWVTWPFIKTFLNSQADTNSKIQLKRKKFKLFYHPVIWLTKNYPISLFARCDVTVIVWC